MTISGSCHCGKIAFRIEADIPKQLTRCTCSFCSKSGALLAYYRPAEFFLITAPAERAEYRWNTRLVGHYFCPTCGCAAYSDSPDFQTDGQWDGHTRRICVNARLFDDFDAALADVLVIDGKHLW